MLSCVYLCALCVLCIFVLCCVYIVSCVCSIICTIMYNHLQPHTISHNPLQHHTIIYNLVQPSPSPNTPLTTSHHTYTYTYYTYTHTHTDRTLGFGSNNGTVLFARHKLLHAALGHHCMDSQGGYDMYMCIYIAHTFYTQHKRAANIYTYTHIHTHAYIHNTHSHTHTHIYHNILLQTHTTRLYIPFGPRIHNHTYTFTYTHKTHHT